VASGGPARNRLRIIGGSHRGRKLAFPDRPGLRPTPDRVRETLFNWLQPVIDGARCLDLFAGSGALGMEAASRGAARVLLLDSAAAVVRQLRDNIQLLQLGQVQVEQADALRWLGGSPEPFDIVFVDPPYASRLQGRCAERLEAGGWLAPAAHIYLEADAGGGLPRLPVNWGLIREKKAGAVRYCLLRRGEGG